MDKRYDIYSHSVKKGMPNNLSHKEKEINKIFGIEENGDNLVILNETKVPNKGITYITGYSGGGKTTLINLIKSNTDCCQELSEIDDQDESIFQIFKDMNIADFISWISKFGLAEAKLFNTPYRYLSEGQKYRVKLAYSLKDIPKTIIIDEFLSVLDRVTANIVAFNFQKICRQYDINAYIATANTDLIQSINPDNVIEIDLDGSSTTYKYKNSNIPSKFPYMDKFTVEEGTIDDYFKLNKYHYVDLDCDKELKFSNQIHKIRVIKFDGKTIGIRLFVQPYPKAFNKIELFKQLNDKILWTYRTIIHPSFRGIGLVKLLDLNQHESKGKTIVSISALAKYYPFNTSSGFKPFEHPRNKRLNYHNELENILTSLGVDDYYKLDNLSFCEKFIDSIEENALEKIIQLSKKITIKHNTDYFFKLCELTNLNVEKSDYESYIAQVFSQVTNCITKEDYSFFLGGALYWNIQGFYRIS